MPLYKENVCVYVCGGGGGGGRGGGVRGRGYVLGYSLENHLVLFLYPLKNIDCRYSLEPLGFICDSSWKKGPYGCLKMLTFEPNKIQVPSRYLCR